MAWQPDIKPKRMSELYPKNPHNVALLSGGLWSKNGSMDGGARIANITGERIVLPLR